LKGGKKMENTRNFTHLHVHTGFSLLDGSSKIKELVKKTKELGMDSIAITDHGVMYGCVEFYKAAKAEGIKPIIGCEVYVASKSRFDKENSPDNFYYHLVLLAENNKGYDNLIKIVSYGFKDGFYYKPRVDIELLEKYHEGIIALSACLAGPVARTIIRQGYDKAKEVALRYNNIFGENNFFLELQDHMDGSVDQQTVNQSLMRMHQETGIPLVATNDCHYISPEDAEAHDILLCIQTNTTVDEADRMRYEGGQYYVKSPEEMYSLFPYAHQACENTYKIAQRCNVEFEFGNYKLPVFDVPDGKTAVEYLSELASNGLKERYGEVTPKLKERLDYELSIIIQMGFVDYFLIVWDFIKYAKDNGISVGPGRGSAAGSIVAYSLRITDIDPIKYDLIFERFLNPERVSMPDIDIDFCYERRGEVIDYVRRKYGNDQVVQIVTFGTMAARNAIRDVGRALNIPYADVDRVAKMVPQELHITIEKALVKNPEFKEIYDTDPTVKHLIDMSMKLEGLPRHTSTHAAGVIISDRPVEDYVPLNLNVKDNAITTQYTMTICEELGLLKMDFLGLRTLTVIQNAFKEIERNYGLKFDGHNIDYGDREVYDLISSGKTLGVFQLESPGMTSFMKELRPNNIEDIIAGISLYRPGPMDFIPKYIDGKNNPSHIKYTHPLLEPILRNTYGCIVYQEQVMQIVQELAGYSLGRSDMVRRAMSKKKADVMAKERENFINGLGDSVPGCVKNGIPANIANIIFDEMTDFAKYAFNKSHAACYAVVAYQTAWLKTHYPAEFMAALMTSVQDRPDKIALYIANCKTMNIGILPPDINESLSNFSVSDGNIRFGLSAIKGVGSNNITSIMKNRSNEGNFKSLHQFLDRMGSNINSKTIESLIYAGAFDSLGGKRSQYIQSYKKMYDGLNSRKKSNIEGQMSLFQLGGESSQENYKDELPNVPEFENRFLLDKEKEYLGIYVSGHPLDEYNEVLSKYISNSTLDFAFEEEDFSNPNKITDGTEVIVGGIVTAVKKHYTKSNQQMAFVTIEDLYGTIDIIVFPAIYTSVSAFLTENNIILVKGRASVSEDKGSSILANAISDYDHINRKNQTLWIRIPKDSSITISDVSTVTKKHAGDVRVIIYDEKTGQKMTTAREGYVSLNDILLEELKELVGESSLVVR
jgi:DNA polymerase-3 subunit alpha